MVSSLFRKWSTIIRLLPLCTSSAQQLLPTILDEITDVEQCNLSVKVISTDAYPMNVSLFKVISHDHKPQLVIPYPGDSTRSMYLTFNFVHLLKRNNCLN